MLNLLRNVGVTMKLMNFSCLTKTIDYLGGVIRPRRPYIVFHDTNAVKELKSATNISGIRSFVGFSNAIG